MDDLEKEEVSRRTIKYRKQDLAIALQGVSIHPRPKVTLEQYTIPADLAAEMLFLACYVHGDIEAKTVADLGTGTGRLAIGASILGAREVVGIDLDNLGLNEAKRSGRLLDAEVDWVLGDIGALRGPFDTVVMNPPFGTKQAHADIRFLRVALKLSGVIYSIHKSSTRAFIERWLNAHESKVHTAIRTRMEIPHQFDFHTKKKHHVDVDLLRIIRR